jgi:hypothetical protein
MLVGKMSYFMHKILENGDLMISYELSISDVVKYAQISMPGYLFCVLVFWYYHYEKSFK